MPLFALVLSLRNYFCYFLFKLSKRIAKAKIILSSEFNWHWMSKGCIYLLMKPKLLSSNVVWLGAALFISKNYPFSIAFCWIRFCKFSFKAKSDSSRKVDSYSLKLAFYLSGCLGFIIWSSGVFCKLNYGSYF